MEEEKLNRLLVEKDAKISEMAKKLDEQLKIMEILSQRLQQDELENQRLMKKYLKKDEQLKQEKSDKKILIGREKELTKQEGDQGWFGKIKGLILKNI
ncbi:unnamed protein product [Blepharisma stoltei]|uniref:Uncharacterized protein n=1 Tax=Blepharisma stoltei TaxID=1481888 RepID=A0AAU9JZA4_9CILI|nr:unnamed protein product [Blepharisma stoltei]